MEMGPPWDRLLMAEKRVNEIGSYNWTILAGVLFAPCQRGQRLCKDWSN